MLEKIFLLDQFSKISPLEDHTMSLRGPRRAALITILSWLKDCYDTITNRLTRL